MFFLTTSAFFRLKVFSNDYVCQSVFGIFAVSSEYSQLENRPEIKVNA